MSKLSPRQNAILKIALTILTLVALFVIIRGRDDLSKDAILTAIKKVKPINAFWVALLGAGQIFFMILRMYVLGSHEHRVPFKDVTFAVAVGHAVNMFFPARAGEALKAIWLGKAGGGDTGYLARGAGWCVADRIVDLSGFVSMVVLTQVLFLPAFGQIIPFPLWYVPAGALGLALVLFLLFRSAQGTGSKVRVWLTQLREGLSGVLSPSKFFLGWLAGLGAWATEIAAIGILAQSQGIHLNVTEIFFVLVVLNIAIAVPVSVANVGTFEASMAFALKFFGVDLSTSIAIAAAHHVLQLAGIAGWALVALLWNKGRSPVAPESASVSGPSI